MKKNTLIISNNQAIFLSASIPLGALLAFSITGQLMGHNIWIPLVISIGLGFLYTMMIKNIFQLYPEQDLMQIFQSAFGPLAKGIAFFCLLQLLFVFAAYSISTIYFWAYIGMYNTPPYVFMLIIVMMTSLAAYYGIDAIARISILVIIAFLILATIDTLAIYNMMKIENLFPIGPVEIKTLLIVTLQFFARTFGVIFIILLFFKHIEKKAKQKAPKALFLGLLIASIYYVINIFRSIFVLGDEMFLQYYHVMYVLKSLEWHTSYARLDIIGITTLISAAFLFLMVNNYANVYIGAKIFNKQDHRKAVLPIAIVEFAIFYLIYIFDLYEQGDTLAWIGVGFTAVSFLIFVIVYFRGIYLRKRDMKKNCQNDCPCIYNRRKYLKNSE
ncbi:MAG: GerAB/ArcD/ProY family transporter [Bacillota bacterium]|jgi:hypothetical protein